MTIEEIYEDKFFILNKTLGKAYNQLAKAIERDKEYSLADDEVCELIYELWEMWIDDPNK